MHTCPFPVPARPGPASPGPANGTPLDSPRDGWGRLGASTCSRASPYDARHHGAVAVVTTPHNGKWFEELPVGLVVQHALTRTVTETDNVLFTTMTMNPARVHLDYEYAAGTEFGQPLVNSMFTLGLLVGISVLETT